MNKDHFANQDRSKVQINALKKHMIKKIGLLRKVLPKKGRLLPVDLAKKVDEMFQLEAELALAPESSQFIPFKNVSQHFRKLDWGYLVDPNWENDELERKNPEVKVNIGYLKVLESIVRDRTKREAFFWSYFRERFMNKFQFTGAFAEFDEITTVLSRTTLVNQPREMACAATLNFYSKREMPNLATGAMYAKKHVSKEIVDEVKEMIENVKTALIEILNDKEWMSPEVKKVAIAKLQHQSLNIAYPEWTLNNTLLDDYYRKLIKSLNGSSTFSSYLSKIREYLITKDYEKIGTEVDTTQFIYPSGFVNGAHSANLNTMQLPAGMFRPPYFRLDYPKAVNYAILGAVIGHEYSHTFDATGKEYNELGNKKNWWDDFSKENYGNLTGCLVSQFDKLQIPGTNLSTNGSKTLSENIADDGGLKVALKAYKNWLKTQPGGEEPRIPGFEHLTNEQMFFAAFGRGYCSMNTVNDKTERYVWDAHAGDYYRAVIPIKNSPDFEEIFQCSKESEMVRDKRCGVW